MDEVDISCPACGGYLYRRSLDVLVNVRRRQIASERDKFLCGNCRHTYSDDEIDENDMRGIPATEGW